MEPSAFDVNTTSQQQQLNYEQHGQVSLPHMMPLPAATPWNLDSMPWAVATKSSDHTGAVMQFRAQNELLQDTIQKRAQLHQKRKSNIAAPHPPKQFISEEKITAHFNGLHISSDYIQQTDGGLDATTSGLGGGGEGNELPAKFGKSFTNLTYHDYQVTAKELEEKLKKAQRITMCEEIKRMHDEQKKSSFLPHALLNRIEKPCTALVLWQRPPLLDIIETTKEIISKQSQKDVNGVDEESFFETDAEIDDLGDNNNSCNMDLNSTKFDGMDTDL